MTATEKRASPVPFAMHNVELPPGMLETWTECLLRVGPVGPLHNGPGHFHRATFLPNESSRAGAYGGV